MTRQAPLLVKPGVDVAAGNTGAKPGSGVQVFCVSALSVRQLVALDVCTLPSVLARSALVTDLADLVRLVSALGCASVQGCRVKLTQTESAGLGFLWRESLGRFVCGPEVKVHLHFPAAGNTGCGNTGAGNVGDYNSGSGNQGYCNQGSGRIGTGLSGGDAPGCKTVCPSGSNLAGQPAPGTPCPAGQTFQLTAGGCAYGLAECCKCVGPTPTRVTPAPAPSVPRKLAPAPAPGQLLEVSTFQLLVLLWLGICRKMCLPAHHLELSSVKSAQ